MAGGANDNVQFRNVIHAEFHSAAAQNEFKFILSPFRFKFNLCC